MVNNTVVSTVKQLKDDVPVDVRWEICDWKTKHTEIVAAEASCYVEVGNPKVRLRFFLRLQEKLTSGMPNAYPVLTKWYSLCAEILTQLNENGAIEVTAKSNGIALAQNSGTISLTKLKDKVVVVIDRFINLESSTMNQNGVLNNPTHLTTATLPDVTFTINARLLRLIENGNNLASLDLDAQDSANKTEESLIHGLKTIFVEHDNYADLKLESKDQMTLDAHKIILAARSQYLKKCIDDAMKTENFNGTMKINVNGKPLVVILHWMYSGELHDNLANVMEEVVDAAILFELTQLIKQLDKKLITICNKANMFRLYQLAQKNGMPKATDDMSAYIRENL